MPITAVCSMRRYQATAVAMATASWRTCRERDKMRSTDRRVINAKPLDALSLLRPIVQ